MPLSGFHNDCLSVVNETKGRFPIGLIKYVLVIILLANFSLFIVRALMQVILSISMASV